MAEDKPKGIKRNDPDPRPVEGTLSRVALTGKDPTKHYVWVSEVNNISLNPQSYLSMGYRFTQYDRDAELPAALGWNPDMKQGDQMRGHGCVLMEIDQERHAELVQNGAPGAGSGQRWADAIQQHIRNQEELRDPEEPRSAAETAKTRGIRTGSYGDDSRRNWSF